MTEKMPAYIAFQGGGVLGMAHLGAWREVAQQFEIKGVAGTSAGSIVAAFCAAGFSPGHTIDIFRQLNWSEYVQRQGMRALLSKRDGLADGENFRKWLRDKLIEHVNKELNQKLGDINFDQLYNVTKIYLAIVACDINNKSYVVFDRDKTPDDSVPFAVRASISIPILFSPVEIKNKNQLLVDGGVLLNYPIKLLYERAKEENSVLIGVRFEEELKYLEKPKVWQTSQATLKAMQESGNQASEEICKYEKYIEIKIDVEGFDFLNFKMSEKEKEKLLKNGEQAAKSALTDYRDKKSKKPSMTSHNPPKKPPLEKEEDIYVERPPIENVCYKELLKSAALVRIKAPRWMGKTWLAARTLKQLTQQGYRTVRLDLKLAQDEHLNDLNRFLKWFCVSVGQAIGLDNQLSNNYWDETFYTPKSNCTNYFEKYLLTQGNVPLILCLDDVDRVFPYEAVASEFLGMLRAWHEQAKTAEIWEKLHLLIVHSTEVYIPLNINSSPFNVGLSIELPEFNLQQVQELTQLHELNCSKDELEDLRELVGGHPYLLEKAFFNLKLKGNSSLQQILKDATTQAGIYYDHLQHLWRKVQKQEDLSVALKNILRETKPVRLEAEQARQLYRIGLVYLRGNDVVMRCNLYRQYFGERLGGI